jgi:hypothetical protein
MRTVVRRLYSLSYRDLEELMQERGYTVDHSTMSCHPSPGIVGRCLCRNHMILL